MNGRILFRGVAQANGMVDKWQSCSARKLPILRDPAFGLGSGATCQDSLPTRIFNLKSEPTPRLNLQSQSESQSSKTFKAFIHDSGVFGAC